MPSNYVCYGWQPCSIQGILSQDCYCFTLGPGAFDLTFLCCNDQIYKYKYNKVENYNKNKVIYLPLHDQKYVNEAKPIPKNKFNLKKDTIISASSNMWKSFFGDEDSFLNILKEIIKDNPKYHHFFIGTVRGYDTLQAFIKKNPEVKNNIHYVGEIKNIFTLLKTIDFGLILFLHLEELILKRPMYLNHL